MRNRDIHGLFTPLVQGRSNANYFSDRASHAVGEGTRSAQMSAALDPRSNQLLASLPHDILERWLPNLELIGLPFGKVLYEPRDALGHVYFPTTAIVSLLYVMQDGASAEIAAAGNEGLIGIALCMGGESTPSRAVVRSAGYAFRMEAHKLKEEFSQHGPVQELLLRYMQALFAQTAQTAVCNRHHSVDQQLCRWLLLSFDRLPGAQLIMTQELISNMLGVRREGVTEAAVKLQNAGVIRYSRGHITVLNRSGLEKLTCECYAVVKREYARLLPPLLDERSYCGRGRHAD
jgi:CRP-like cAMP-binding protein